MKEVLDFSFSEFLLPNGESFKNTQLCRKPEIRLLKLCKHLVGWLFTSGVIGGWEEGSSIGFDGQGDNSRDLSFRW